MGYKEDLEKLNAQKEGCVAFAEYDGVSYLAVKGSNVKKNNESNRYNRISDIVKEIFEDEPIVCKFEEAYTIVEPSKCDKYTNKYIDRDRIYRDLHSKDGYVIEDIIPKTKWDSGIPSKMNRNWTCSERKILGHLDETIELYDLELYITDRPCPLCIPVVGVTHYLLDDKLEDATFHHVMINSKTMKNTIS